MKDFYLAVAYLIGVGWLGVECMALAGAGTWWPLILFLLAFVVALSVLGCVPPGGTMVDRLGSGFALLIAAGLAIFAVLAFGSGAVGAVIQLLFALGYAALALRGLTQAGRRPAPA